MADPVVVSLTAGVWTKIATDVTSGMVHPLSDVGVYAQTYRDTGGVAPTGTEEGVVFLASTPIEASAGIDVYVRCSQAGGKVRVDLA